MVRTGELHEWVESFLPNVSWPPVRLAGDASFRSYYRVQAEDQRYILMDASPEKENCQAFVAIDRCFRAKGLCVPEVYASNFEKGFLLLSDFGDTLYLDQLNQETAPRLYQTAVESLLVLQTCKTVAGYALPLFDDALYQKEFNLFHDWFLVAEKKRQLTPRDFQSLQAHYFFLRDEIKKQPKVCVHLDYHSRNLMVLPENRVGILDFQDAVWGPVTYDILSLYRDCYIDWPQENITQWLQSYHEQLVKRKIMQETSFDLFEKWFDWTGVQRHLKCVGIFSRLTHLYNKPNYHQYLGRTVGYLRQVCAKYKELQFFLPFLED